MTRHSLDRPVWSALVTTQARFAVGDERARRFAADIGPLASARDDEPESMAALAALVPEEGTLMLLQADAIVLPPSVRAISTAEGIQLVADRLVPVPSDAQIEPLTAADAPSMLELAALTKPGPFALRTPALGQFWGVKVGGSLLAMAGERMKQDGFTEVSGVCTHPDARGRGYARALSAKVAAQIVARGKVPYLHTYATNTAAIRLYESLGFRVRRPVNIAVVARV
jgi:predicted GNAT family acetyltransferase